MNFIWKLDFYLDLLEGRGGKDNRINLNTVYFQLFSYFTNIILSGFVSLASVDHSFISCLSSDALNSAVYIRGISVGKYLIIWKPCSKAISPYGITNIDIVICGVVVRVQLADKCLNFLCVIKIVKSITCPINCTTTDSDCCEFTQYLYLTNGECHVWIQVITHDRLWHRYHSEEIARISLLQIYLLEVVVGGRYHPVRKQIPWSGIGLRLEYIFKGTWYWVFCSWSSKSIHWY